MKGKGKGKRPKVRSEKFSYKDLIKTLESNRRKMKGAK